MGPKRRKKRGLLFVVSAPSGCGKTTIGKKVTSVFPTLSSSISVTTRPPRDNEKSGRDYYFVSKNEFLKKREKGELLEWAGNFGHLYGTPKKGIEKAARKDEDILLTIDVKGARKVKKAIPESIHIFLMPPSMSDLKKRLRKRGTDKLKDIKKRLNVARREIKEARRYDYVIVNDNVAGAVKRLKAIIRLERSKKSRW